MPIYQKVHWAVNSAMFAQCAIFAPGLATGGLDGLQKGGQGRLCPMTTAAHVEECRRE